MTPRCDWASVSFPTTGNTVTYTTNTQCLAPITDPQAKGSNFVKHGSKFTNQPVETKCKTQILSWFATLFTPDRSDSQQDALKPRNNIAVWADLDSSLVLFTFRGCLSQCKSCHQKINALKYNFIHQSAPALQGIWDSWESSHYILRRVTEKFRVHYIIYRLCFTGLTFWLVAAFFFFYVVVVSTSVSTYIKYSVSYASQNILQRSGTFSSVSIYSKCCLSVLCYRPLRQLSVVKLCFCSSFLY